MVFKPLIIDGKEVSRLGLGSWALGGGPDWGDTEESAVFDTVSAALDGGINWIDTAPAYGWGRAEELLGRVLKGRREKVFLADKCGIILKEGRPDHDLRPECIFKQCDESLSRLQTDYIDLYQIHWPDPNVPPGEALGALERLKERGKIRALGVCNFSADMLRCAAEAADVACVQNPLSLLDKRSEEALKVCLEKGLPFAAYGVLGGGILSGKYRKAPNFRRRDARRYFYKHYFGEEFTAAQEVAARVKEAAAQKHTAASAVALAWVLAQEGVSCALAGARTAAQAKENALALQTRLNREETEYLEYGRH